MGVWTTKKRAATGNQKSIVKIRQPLFSPQISHEGEFVDQNRLTLVACFKFAMEAGMLHLRAGLGARHEVLLPSARQAILTAGPWVSHPWFEQFLRAVTPLRDQRFHRCSGDHAIG